MIIHEMHVVEALDLGLGSFMAFLMAACFSSGGRSVSRRIGIYVVS
jgi:hypothetical protein